MNEHEHNFVTDEDGVDRCSDCDVTFLEHTRGFGSNVTPRGFFRRTERKANDWTPPKIHKRADRTTTS